MNIDIIIYVFVGMAIITWVFWLVKKGLINPENFIKDRQQKKPDNNTKQIQVEVIDDKVHNY